jgi:hypothetical protein
VLAAMLTAGCPAEVPAPEGAPLVYAGPTEVRLAPGETLQPTDIVFLGAQDKRGEFIISDFKATRQIGDSVDWDGEPLPGVRLRLRLRVIWFRDEGVYLAGTVRAEVSDVQPASGRLDQKSAVAYRVPVSYQVPKGKLIPGTTWGYARPTERGAELTGLDEYPYRKVADSILWEGRLQPDIGLALNLRVIYYDEQALQVAGIATVTFAATEEGT